MAGEERQELDRLRRELASGEEPGDAGQRGAVDLAERVFAKECIAYPEAIRLHAAGFSWSRGARSR